MGGSWLFRKSVSLDFWRVEHIPNPLPKNLHYASEDDPLLQAIIRKSESELLALLQEARYLHQIATDEFLLQTSILWPRGLCLLLESGADVSIIDQNGYSALEFAVEVKRDDSVDILLKLGCPFTAYAWNKSRGESRRLIKDAIIKQIASETRHESSIPTTADHCLCKTTSPLQFVYSGENLTADEAESFFQAGLHCIDHESTNETHLWVQVSSLAYTERGKFDPSHLELFMWFINKGARLDRKHPRLKTLLAHLLAERLAIGILLPRETMADQDMTAYEKTATGGVAITNEGLNHAATLMRQCILQYDFRDTCQCACSEGGCGALSTVLRALSSCYCSFRSSFPPPLPFQNSLERYLLTLLDLVGFEVEVDVGALSIVRALTFDHLQLSHTCHDHGHSYQQWSHDRIWIDSCKPVLPLCTKEIEDIQYVELSDISLLEDLVVEFDATLRDFEGSFQGFIEGPWRQRMQEVDNERYAPRQDEPQKIEELGVIIQPYGPETAINEADEPEFGSWEWFKQEVDEIMNPK
ncbi:hypothetical protein K469DRAFT_400924 [Zopfia rhizophila CBS 207.26]|uniref:Uncharacterized protein n=1 Tax=Zopfia rhizophila CBS 207.26 TaxID=1314779 RepID=A0A6A6DEB0_9PEZI|nr:hypothetical protein K469DRAFT_400924 [Zopfia rhizophila CBS 207.26]